MKIKYDPVRDLLYISFGMDSARKAAETVTISPGVHADLDTRGKLIGIEVIDASEVLGERVEFGVELGVLHAERVGVEEQ